jgi:drug/metabolite transporter (DMT)-like permease
VSARAALLSLAAAFVFTMETVFLKLIDGTIPTATVVLARGLGQVLVTLPLMHGSVVSHIRTERFGLHALRGVLTLTSWGAYYLSFNHLSLATATVLSFTSVMFVTALAGPVLGEVVRWRRWSATLFGFLGVLLVARPGSGVEPVWLGFALLSAACGAAIVLSTKILSRTEGTQTIMLWVGIFGTLGALPFALPSLAWHGWREMGLLLGLAVCGPVGMYLWVTALRLADASALAPVSYTRLVFAGLFGVFLFNEVPDWLSVAGAGVIVGSALFITYREAKVGKVKAAALAAKPAGNAPPRPMPTEAEPDRKRWIGR